MPWQRDTLYDRMHGDSDVCGGELLSATSAVDPRTLWEATGITLLCWYSCPPIALYTLVVQGSNSNGNMPGPKFGSSD